MGGCPFASADPFLVDVWFVVSLTPFFPVASVDVGGTPLVAGGGVLARRRTSVRSSGKVVQVPERSSSSARARTRSVQPAEASEVVSVSWSCEIVDGSLWRWRSRARWVGCGRVVLDEGERLLGTGMVEVSGEMEVEGGMVVGGGWVYCP